MLSHPTKVVAPILSLLIIAAFALAGWSFVNSHNESCASRDAGLDVLYDILKKTEPSPVMIEAMTPKRRTFVIHFYKSSYERIQQARC